jgi:hypothetical protein
MTEISLYARPGIKVEVKMDKPLFNIYDKQENSIRGYCRRYVRPRQYGAKQQCRL